MKQLITTVLILALAGSALSDEFDDVFSDDPFADVDIGDVNSPVKPWNLSHRLTLQSLVNINSDQSNAVETRYSGLTSLDAAYQPRLTIDFSNDLTVTADVRLASDSIFWLRADDDWSDEDIDARQYQWDIRELTGQGRLGSWQLSSGIQTVTLGLADALSVANVLYAQDLAIPGTTDIEDTMIPAWTTVVSGAAGPVRLRAGAVHRHQINRIPATGTDFDSGLVTRLDQVGLSYEPEALALDTTGWFASVSGVIGPLDWQLNGISQLAHTPSLELGLMNTQPVPVAVTFPRQNTAALAASYVTGPFLWKTEAAVTDGLLGQNKNGQLPGDMQSYQRIAGTFGFDFDHSTLGRFIAEVQFTQILDYDQMSLMNIDEQTAQWALVYSQKLLRDTLSVNAQMIAFHPDASGGRIQGLGMEYDLNDHWQLRARVIDYVGGEFQLLEGADDRDRVLLAVDYRF